MAATLGAPGVDVAAEEDRLAAGDALHPVVDGAGLRGAQGVEGLLLAEVAAVPIVEVDRDDEEVLAGAAILELGVRRAPAAGISVAAHDRHVHAAGAVVVLLAGGLAALTDQAVIVRVVEDPRALRGVGGPRATYAVVRTSWYRPAPTLRQRRLEALGLPGRVLDLGLFPSARPGPSSWIATIPGLRLLISRATEIARFSQWREVPMSAREVRTLKVAKRTSVPVSTAAMVPSGTIGAASALRLGRASSAKVVAAAAASARSGADRIEELLLVRSDSG